jgi:hypothetical protein
MTWMAHGDPMHGNLMEITHYTDECGAKRCMGSARWYLHRIGADKYEERSVIWPPLKSPARVRMAEFVIANAALLGAQFVEIIPSSEPGWDGKRWGIENHRISLGWHEDQAEAASAFLSMKGFWACFNKDTNEWELVRI